MKCTNAPKYKPKTVRVPFKNAEEETDFERYLDVHGLNKGRFILALIRKELIASSPSSISLNTPTEGDGAFNNNVEACR